jgi:hypothetical protein
MMEETFDISGSLLDFYYWLNVKLMDDTVHSRLHYKNGDMALWVRGPAPDSEGGRVIVDGVYHHNDPDQQFQRVHERIEGVLCFEGMRMPDGTTHIELVSYDEGLEQFYNDLRPQIGEAWDVPELLRAKEVEQGAAELGPAARNLYEFIERNDDVISRRENWRNYKDYTRQPTLSDIGNRVGLSYEGVKSVFKKLRKLRAAAAEEAHGNTSKG